MKAPYVDIRDASKPPDQLAFTHLVTARIPVRARIVFVSACAVHEVFESLWSITNDTPNQVLIVPTVQGRRLYWSSQAWIHLLQYLTKPNPATGQTMNVEDAVAAVNAGYLAGVDLKFRVIGANGGRNVRFK